MFRRSSLTKPTRSSRRRDVLLTHLMQRPAANNRAVAVLAVGAAAGAGVGYWSGAPAIPVTAAGREAVPPRRHLNYKRPEVVRMIDSPR